MGDCKFRWVGRIKERQQMKSLRTERKLDRIKKTDI